MQKCKIIVKKILIFLIALITGFYIFEVGTEEALQSRGYQACGGEFFLLFSPILFYLLLSNGENILRKVIKKQKFIKKERSKKIMEDENNLRELLPIARLIDSRTNRSEITIIGAVQNNSGCITVYKDNKGNYWKEQLRYKTLADGRTVATKEPVVKRTYKKYKPRPQCY